MTTSILFTSNHQDISTQEGYQFEFRCLRCGTGFRSQFRHSVTGFAARLATIGGSLLGGEVGNRIEEVGLLAGWNRSGTRGSTNDKRLIEASQDVTDQFLYCRRCGGWVCRPACWNPAADCCADCDPPTLVSASCAVCGHITSGRFCADCGTPLNAPTTCRGCGQVTRSTRFCPHCGTPAGG